MATNKKALLKKSGKPSGNKNRNRHQLVLDTETSKKGEQIAKAAHRSFNNTVEVLILQEHARLFPSAQKEIAA